MYLLPPLPFPVNPLIPSNPTGIRKANPHIARWTLLIGMSSAEKMKELVALEVSKMCFIPNLIW